MKEAFKMKQKAFLIIFKGPSLKQGGGESIFKA